MKSGKDKLVPYNNTNEETIINEHLITKLGKGREAKTRLKWKEAE